MIVNLFKAERMFEVTLPEKINGRYWITDLDGKKQVRNLASIEAVNNAWILNGNKNVVIYTPNKERVHNVELTASSFLFIEIIDTNERAILSAESLDVTRQLFAKIAVTRPAVFKIGRSDINNFRYDSELVTAEHATLSFDGTEWSISDVGSKNGTYVNGFRVKDKKLSSGDLIYIAGLKIVVGNNFLAINNPDEKLKVKSDVLQVYNGQNYQERGIIDSDSEQEYFFRSPRFYRDIIHQEITIDPPPAPTKIDTVPMALMLGPSLTMGMTSLSTGILSFINVMGNNGNIRQAIPTLIMSVGMLTGTVLWPILTKKREKREKIKNELKRQELYSAYLDSVSDEISRIGKNQVEILKENIISQDVCAERIARKEDSLWERVIGQDDFLRLRLGTGDIPIDLHIKYQQKKFQMEEDSLQNAMLAIAETKKILKNAPISISFTDNMYTGIFGEKQDTDNMLKSLILQMVSLHSYDELKIMLIVDDFEKNNWSFVKCIPHFWTNDKEMRFFATNADEVSELASYVEKNILTRPDSKNSVLQVPHYVIISTSRTLLKKSEAFSKVMEYENPVSLSTIFTGAKFSDFPKETNLLINLEWNNCKIYDKNDTSGKEIIFVPERINENILDNLASRLANIELDLDSQKYLLPSMITFLEMFGVGKVEHLNSLKRWKDNNPTKSLQAPVGYDTAGDLFNLDIHEKYHGPHGLVAGMTGSGKSEFIITYILSLAVNYHPSEVSFILIDYKGGGLTGAFEDEDRGIKLPHLAGTITNLDGSSIKRSLVSIQSELRRRQALFNEARRISNEGTMDIYKYQALYREGIVTEPCPHLLIISDEFAELKMQQPEFMEQLISAARIGRSLGVHLILATQKPSGVVDDQIWSNSKFRVCLKVQDKADSNDMIKRPDAAEISQTGRFFLQVGFNEFFAMGQSAWCGADYVPAETAEKTQDVEIQVIDNIGRVAMKVKKQKEQAEMKKRTKQIVEVVKYLSDLAVAEKVSSKPLWLEPIPSRIFIDELKGKYNVPTERFVLNEVIGEYDDPFNQKQCVLTVPFSADGNVIVFGAAGNGKTTFLTSLTYSLITYHSVDEVNVYLLDFGAETLKAFEKAPHVGAVITAGEDEKILNFFKMIKKELEVRKELFAEYGGDYSLYIKNSGKTLPNIVIMINNITVFGEQYEDFLEDLNLITREGTKYGVYCVLTSTSVNGVRYKIQQNCKIIYTMQLNDPIDYTLVVGRTDGLLPAKFKGRGLVQIDKPFEFQTAYCQDTDDVLEFIRGYSKKLASETELRATRIPVLPNAVNYEFISPYISGINNIPIGVNKESLEIETVNLERKPMLQVVAQSAEDAIPFVIELTKVLKAIAEVTVFDAEKLVEGSVQSSFDNYIVALFDDLVARNNEYKESGGNESVLNKYPEKVYVIFGIKRLFDILDDDKQDKLRLILEKVESNYKIKFVIVDSAQPFNTVIHKDWYKKHLASGEGLWVGDGISQQTILKLNHVTRETGESLGTEYGYNIRKGRKSLIKLISAGEGNDNE